MAAPDYRALLKALSEHDVEYIIIGGAAMVLQGSSYTTEDLDILYERSLENCGRLANALVPFSPKLRVEGLPEGLEAPLDGKSIRHGLNFTLTTTVGDFDIFGEIAGVGKYHEALAYADESELINGISPIKVLSPAGLIAAKRAAGRPKDLAAIPELEAIEELRRTAEQKKRPRSE